MSTTPYPGPFSPDSPAQRLPWILLIAILLVLLGLVGLGRVLNTPLRPTHKPKPLRARIYELPASRGSAAARPTRPSHKHVPNHPVHRQPPAQTQRQSQAHAPPARHVPQAKQPPRHKQTTTPRSSAKKGVALAHPTHTHRRAATHVEHHHKAITHPAPPPQQARHQAHHNINWGRLQSQINTAVRQSDPSPPQVHDPHTLVARYYIASLLQKLQRIGDMNYPTDLTGVPVLKLVIGTHGELLHLSLLRSSGNDTLDHDALQIARESAPFAPFPDKLKHQTSNIELICYMSFDGYRQIYAGY
ncbi:MAG: TonB family protein [Gammaproteobacteria bacterium]|jgi:periplasmic protein TonB